MAFTPEQEAALLVLIAQPPKIISDLESEVSLNGDEVIPVEDGTGTFGATVNDIADYTINQIGQATESVAGIAGIATQAETIAGTASKIVDPAKLLALFGTSNRSTNGYARLPVKVSGAFVEIILQWGKYTSGSYNPTITLPLTFPNTFINLSSTSNAGTNSAGLDGSIIDNSSFSVRQFNTTSGANRTTDFFWTAIGY